MTRWLISVSVAAVLASASAAALALPTVGDVQAEVQKGNYTQAQSMMREVVEAKPGSAKAHYIYAEILAHNARFGDAAEQARIAKQIDPKLAFTTPEKFAAFQQLLDREQQAARSNVSTPSTRTAPMPRETGSPPAAMPTSVEQRSGGGVPIWVWVGGAALLFIGWKMLNRRSAPTVMGGAAGPVAGYANGAPAGFNNGPGYGPGYGPGAGYAPGMMQQPRAGSGLMGAGLAAAGGVAAGMLAEKYLSGNHGNGGSGNPAFDNGNAFAGNSFAPPANDPAAQELEQRDIDFGSGNGWDDGSSTSSDAGSFDTGGGGGGSDDW